MIKYLIFCLEKIVLFLIRFYQWTLSPDHGLFSAIYPGPGACKFNPTCSEYAVQAIQKYGLFKGVGKAIKRLARCHPWSLGGNDFP